MPDTTQKRQSITRKLLNVVFMVYIVLTLIMTSIEMRTAYHSLHEEIDASFAHLYDFIAPGLVDSLDKQQQPRVNFIAEGVMRNPMVTGILVEPAFDYPQTSIGDTGLGETAVLEDKISLHSRVSWDFLRLFEGEFYESFALQDASDTIIGHLTIYSNQAVIIARLMGIYTVMIFNEIMMALILWFLILWVGKHYLSRPLESLTLATEAVAQGVMKQVHMRKDIQKISELDVLATSFNTMVDKLGKAQARLTHSKRHLEDIIDAMPSALIAMTTKGIVTDYNSQAQAMIHVERDKAIGMHYIDLFPLLLDYQNHVQDVIADNKTEKIQGVAAQDGEITRHLDIILYPILEEEPPGIVIRLDDVSQQAGR